MLKRIESNLYLLLPLLVLVIYIRISPYFVPIPDRDSGVFLYIGSRILQGDIPYQDQWDHKAPFVYYINALGLWLGQGSRWGAWFVEYLVVVASAILGYYAFSKIFSRSVALLVSVLWLLFLPRVLGNGNFVQVYGLFFQFGALFIWVSNKHQAVLWKIFLLGICLGGAFIVQPNLIGLPLVLIVSLIAREAFAKTPLTSQAKLVGSGLIGIVSILLLVFGYFFSEGAISDFWDSVFVYNFYYTQNTSLQDRFVSLLRGSSLMEGLVLLAFMGWIWAVIRLNDNRERKFEKIVFAIVLPLDLLASTASPKPLAHYYISWLPSLALLSGELLFIKGNILTSKNHELKNRTEKLWMYSMSILLMMVYLLSTSPFLLEFGTRVVEGRLVVDISKSSEYKKALYILENTDKSTKVYFWGNEVALNFLTQRLSSSKYIYTYPLFMPHGYATKPVAARFTQDIVDTKPLIIDTKNEFIPPVGELDVEKYPYLQDFIIFFNTYYVQVDTIPASQWMVYKYVGP